MSILKPKQIKAQESPKGLEKVVEIGNNEVGYKESDKNRQKALAMLDKIKEQEEQKKAMGYRWMWLGKTSFLTNPKNFKNMNEQGYKFM